jgi:hypothetical protein
MQILIDKSISPQVFGILRKMKPIRQIEAAEHMVAGETYTVPFATTSTPLSVGSVSKQGTRMPSVTNRRRVRGPIFSSKRIW